MFEMANCYLHFTAIFKKLIFEIKKDCVFTVKYLIHLRYVLFLSNNLFQISENGKTIPNLSHETTRYLIPKAGKIFKIIMWHSFTNTDVKN